MIILDTTIWIEFLKNKPEYYSVISKLLERKEVFAVECVFGELLQGVKTGYEKEIITEYWKYLPKLNYQEIIIEAGNYSCEHKLLDKGVGLIDAVILAHGIKSNSRIWTTDTKFLRVIPDGLKYTCNE
ncbi:MAG: PIN domain-containing protein [Campylobacteraceae bacterium]|jgi:predicted nucleic acid-binding protein|nr:PIN domain-containing protein [Campylobacteraceae bacterium]